MAWVHFLTDWSWHPTPRSTVDFKAGDVKNVPHLCAEAAIEAGKAEPKATPAREEAEGPEGEAPEPEAEPETDDDA